jgi:uncharacterized membrane protein
MSIKKSILISSVIATGLMMAAIESKAGSKNKTEKCYGIAKAGKNDCGNSRHSCAGQSTEDALTDEWIYVRRGNCEKIVGGSTVSKPSRR